MPKFTHKSDGTSPPQPHTPPSVTDPKPRVIASHSLYSMLRTANVLDHGYDVYLTFVIPGGEVPLLLKDATAETVEAELLSASEQGIVFRQADGFVWFPPSSIKQVNIKL
jgi:hypothetical protein